MDISIHCSSVPSQNLNNISDFQVITFSHSNNYNNPRASDKMANYAIV